MTAEIAIMNKSGVALAADSAVTIRTNQAPKIYNTANKLFSLSRFHPVGIMVFASASFMGVPWETLIKLFRKKLGSHTYPQLTNYADSFIDYLKKSGALIPEGEQEEWLEICVTNFLLRIKNRALEEIGEYLKHHKRISEKRSRAIINRKIFQTVQELGKRNFLKGYRKKDAEFISKDFLPKTKKAIATVFQNFNLNKLSERRIEKIPGLLFTKEIPCGTTSGVVISGFGEDEIFPSLRTFLVEGLYKGRLKFIESDKQDISFNNPAAIVPFAQSEMVSTFVEGIDPKKREFIHSYLREVFNQFPEVVRARLPNVQPKEKEKIISDVRIAVDKLFQGYQAEVTGYMQTYHIRPVIRAVSFLPKDELAVMAETLINLTSFKRKVSLEQETVGGPIDVAVISKGEGFIWIKRKHYFSSELNPGFAINYKAIRSQADEEGK